MGCNCGSRASAVSSTGYTTTTATGYKVTFPDGSTTTYLTSLEAQRAVRKAGGGTVSVVTGS